MALLQYSEEDLNEFDRLTALESSRHQMDRIRARCEWKPFAERFNKETLDNMAEELKKRGRW